MLTCVAMNPGAAQRKFDDAAATFDTADFVIAATRKGLLQRLEPMTLEARLVVDLGAATGSAVRALERRFRHARIVAIDSSHNMLRQAHAKKSWLSKSRYLQAAATALPLADHSVDVIFANQLLPWLADPAPVFTEVSRALRKDGLFVFSTLGPDSLANLRHDRFADMHDVGDALVRAGLRDPVLDVDRLTVTYESTQSLLADCQAIGASHCVSDQTEVLALDFELIYGHCWGSGPRPAGGEFRVDAGDIGRHRR